MTWIKLSLKEWRRRPLLTSVTAAGVAIATAALYSLIVFQNGYKDGVGQELERLGAHVLLVPKGCPYDAASMALHGASWPCYLSQKYVQEVSSVPGVSAVAPVFMTAVYEEGGKQAVYLGVDTNILSLKPSWKISGAFPAQEGDVLVGSEAAGQHGWVVGTQITLPGLTNQAATVAGIVAPTHAAEDAFIYLPLKDAQRRFHHTNELTHILIRLAHPNDLDRAVAQLRGCDAGLAMNVVPLAHVFRTIQSLVNSTRLLLGCIAAVALLVAGAGVSNTILMAVTERQREIGLMRAVGASRIMIFRLIWLETLEVCVTGALAGIFSAYLASGFVETWIRSKLPFAPANSLIHWEWWIAAGCLGSALALGTIAGFPPAWRAASLPPVIAIRAAGGRI